MSEDPVPYNAAPAGGYRDPEGLAWAGQPGQIVNWQIIAAATVAAAILAVFVPWPYTPVAALPLPAIGWFYLVVRCIRYELTSQRLRIASGVFTRRVEEIELYRIEDTGAVAPLAYRLVGRGNVYALTSDRTAPVAVLEAIPEHEAVRRQLRELVEAARRAKGVRLIE